MTVYEYLIGLAQDGNARIHIDLCAKTIKIGRRTLVEHGVLTADDEGLSGLIDEPLDLDELYEQYKFSVPSERDCGHLHYFRALPPSELSDADLVCGMPRLEARIRLEAYILLASASGLLTWESPSLWFRKGADPDFVVLKKYVM